MEVESAPFKSLFRGDDFSEEIEENISRCIKAELSTLADADLNKVAESIDADCSLSKLKEDLNTAQLVIPTGIDFLDEIMHGGIYSGVNIVCGAPNVGKTTLLVQTAISLSMHGQPVIFLTNDMSRTEILLKAITCSCNMLGICGTSIKSVTDKLTSNGGLDEQRIRAYDAACQNLRVIDISLGANAELEKACCAKHDTEISDAMHRISYVMQLYSKLYKKIPIFILDSLQSVSLVNGANKEGVDLTLGVLKNLQRKFNAPMIIVSNLNRGGASQGSYSRMIRIEDLKESGNIEYEASTVIALNVGLDYVSLQEYRSNEIRRVCIANLKHRAGGYIEKDVDFDVESCIFRKTLEDQLTSTSADKSVDAAKADGDKTSKPRHKKSTAGSAKGKNGVDENLLRKSNSIAAFLANCDAKKP